MNFVIGLLPKIFLGLILISVLFFYFKRSAFNLKFICRYFIFAVLGFRLAYSSFLTFAQYYFWSKDSLTKYLLNSSLAPTLPVGAIKAMPWLFDNRLGYFIFYSWGRFWLNLFLTLLIAFTFWWFLKLLKKHKERFFEGGEVELGFLTILISGWPNSLIFLVLAFLGVVAVSIFRLILLKEFYTTLGLPFVLSAIAVFLWGSQLAEIFGLNVLRIGFVF